MLHTWSLSVEMQFCTVVPLLYIIFKKSESFGIFFTICALAISLLLHFGIEHEMISFYFLHFRMWQFLAGSVAFMISWYRSRIQQTGIRHIQNLQKHKRQIENSQVYEREIHNWQEI